MPATPAVRHELSITGGLQKSVVDIVQVFGALLLAVPASRTAPIIRHGRRMIAPLLLFDWVSPLLRSSLMVSVYNTMSQATAATGGGWLSASFFGFAFITTACATAALIVWLGTSNLAALVTAFPSGKSNSAATAFELPRRRK